jgi:hypothetical protein
MLRIQALPDALLIQRGDSRGKRRELGLLNLSHRVCSRSAFGYGLRVVCDQARGRAFVGNGRVGCLLECLLCNRVKLVKRDALTSVLCNDTENLCSSRRRHLIQVNEYVSMRCASRISLYGVIRTQCQAERGCAVATPHQTHGDRWLHFASLFSGFYSC